MAKMRIYTVHIDPKKPQPFETPIFIEEGFCWSAFLFQWVWALYQRLWAMAVSIIGFNLLLTYCSTHGFIHPISVSAIQIGFLVMIGFSANDLRRDQLRKRGYITTDIVTSDNLVGAEQRYFERYFSQKHSAATLHHPSYLSV